VIDSEALLSHQLYSALGSCSARLALLYRRPSEQFLSMHLVVGSIIFWVFLSHCSVRVKVEWKPQDSGISESLDTIDCSVNSPLASTLPQYANRCYHRFELTLFSLGMKRAASFRRSCNRIILQRFQQRTILAGLARNTITAKNSKISFVRSGTSFG
jgi:hypothetical protein